VFILKELRHENDAVPSRFLGLLAVFWVFLKKACPEIQELQAIK
jgi:hypothetical protein